MAGFLEKLYPYFPIWAQNLGISLYGWKYKRERFGPEYIKSLSGFLERGDWDAERTLTYVDNRLREVIRLAFQCQYYRAHWGRAGFKMSHVADFRCGTLQRLPIVPKNHLRANPADFVPSSTRNTKRLISYFSSGSTGTPIHAIYSPESHQRFIAAREARSFGWAGTSIRRPRAMIGGRLVVPKATAGAPFYRYNLAEHQIYFSAFHIGPSNIADYVEGFNRYKPEVITGYAFSQYTIARMMRDQGLRFAYRPVAAITSSEKLTPPMREVISQSWGCRVYEEYGAVENCMLATECEFGGLHVSVDFGIIEIVDDDGQAVPPMTPGRILCTGLLNDAQLLIRYEIGDIGMWSERVCPCGRNHLPVLHEVTGRVEDVVIGPDGREMVRFHGIFIGLPHVVEGQIVQERLDSFVVRVVAQEAFGEFQAREIRRRIEQRLGRVKVEVVALDHLERYPNGKLRAVISHVTCPRDH